jgi:hypothetical protein
MTTENKTENKEKSKIKEEKHRKYLKFQEYYRGYNNGVRKERKNLHLYNQGYQDGAKEILTSILQIINNEIKEEKEFTGKRDWGIVQELEYVKMQISKLQDNSQQKQESRVGLATRGSANNISSADKTYFSGYHNPPEKTKHKEQKIRK